MIENTQGGLSTSTQESTEVKPLTSWKNPPTLLALKQDLTDAKPIHDAQRTKIGVWLDNLNVTGTAKPAANGTNSKIQPKLIRKQAEWRYAALSEPFLSTSTLFNVKPKTWEDRDAAQQNGLVLNQQFNTALDKVKFIDEYVRAAVDEGTVIIQTGWQFEEEEYEADCPVYEHRRNDELLPMMQQLDAMAEQSPSEYQTDVPEELKESHELYKEHGVPYEPVLIGTEKKTKTRTLKNRPTAEIIDYRNVIFDPTCEGDMDRCGFAIKSFDSSLAILKKEPKRYKNLDKINIEGSSILAQPDHRPEGDQNTFNFADRARKKFVVQEYWGYWDIHSTGKLESIVMAWVGDVIIRMELNPFPDKKVPFIVEQYLPVRKATYGEPDGALLEDNQKVVGAVTRGMIDIMGKSANGQTGVSKGMLDVTNKRRFDKGQDYEFNPQVDPRLGVFMHTYPEIPASAQFMLQLQQFEAESMTGVKSFSQGVSGASLGDVAAGVRGALDASSKRELGILRRLSNGIVKLGRKFISMNSEFLSQEEVIRITNEDFALVKRDDLAGDFDLELSISTAEEDNNKAEQLAFLFQTIGPNGDPAMTKMILADIARLRKMPDLAHKIETFQPQPDPVAQKLQELEIAKIEAEIAELQAKAQERLTQAGLNQAKVGTEGAKAANISSDTDQKNLDFVEQESGVKQERSKELHGAQAEAQGRLKLVEASLSQQNHREKLETDLVKEYVKGHFAAKAANSRK